jgi:DNA-binding transcriptional MerR regulator
VKKLYDQREVSRLIGISESQIRYWDRRGLIPHRQQDKGRLLFDFQGLVAFRTVRDLRRQGVSLHKIRKCVDKLRRLMPALQQPLSEVRISFLNEKIVLGKNQLQFTPEGQLLLDFSPVAAAPVSLPVEIYEELFFQALEDEEAGKLDEARKKYETILTVLPEHVDALVNLGTIFYLTDAENDAAVRYLQALGINPDHVEANYNLANLLEGRGELHGAILFYEKALREDPEFADAHFNLAMVLEATGDAQGAKQHWRRYLELDPGSKWSAYIRNRLEEGQPGS